MSRVEFRAEVADARPSSAWALVTVASATLWITEQLAVWAMAIQVAAILYSLLTRRRPHRWQTSAITLNIGMFGIVGATITLALEGNPATVSLAHFAALTQGLQLLDTRPRKSEFLLVALALFQVILAANLTDSILFPPLLAVFLVATTWTLLVHTLRSEAIEAHDAERLSTTINTGLIRTTLFASAVSIVLALVLFVVLPRMRSSMIRGGLGGEMSLSGFSDKVELGTIGRIRQDHTVVLRVETISGNAPERSMAYWRGLAFDRFDGREWSITPISDLRNRHHVPGSPRFGVELFGGTDESTVVQRVIREPVEAGVIFGLGHIKKLDGPLDFLEYDLNLGVYAPGQEEHRVRYTVWTDNRVWNEDTLRTDRSAPPRDRGQPPRDDGRRYLDLPDLDPAVAALAERLTADAGSDADRARAIERHLRSVGSYTDTPPDMGAAAGQSPVERFLLGELSGHCEYFASGMVVLARSVGLQSRLVNGFAGGRENRLGGFVELARSDAHAWVEVHYEDAGWVRYDPTPPDLRLRSELLTAGEQLAQLFSVIEIWWFQRVVDFDSSDQMRALKSIWAAWRSFRSTTTTQVDGEGSSISKWSPDAEVPWDTIGLIGAIAMLSIALARRKKNQTSGPVVPKTYTRALRLLARRGLRRPAHSTARGFAREASRSLSSAGATAFSALTEAYLAERFGGAAAGPTAHLEALKQALKAKPQPQADSNGIAS